jgi:hypothetical protein
MTLVLVLLCALSAAAQTKPPAISDQLSAPPPAVDIPLSRLAAGAHAPLYTTYAAPLGRSEYFVDAAYHLDYDVPELGVTWSSQKQGDMALAWRLGKMAVAGIRDFYRKPIVRRSYTDLAEVEYWPFTTLQVRETFDVYSSRMAIWDVEVTNHATRPQDVMVYAYYLNPAEVSAAEFHDQQYVLFQHSVDWKQWFETPQPKFDPNFRDIFLTSFQADTWSGHPDAGLIPEMLQRDFLNGMVYGRLRGFALAKRYTLQPGQVEHFRIIRGMQQSRDKAEDLVAQAGKLLTLPLAPVIAESEAQYKDVPRNLKFPGKEYELAYWSAFNLVRQQMMPPEGESKTNYYVFSREPTWSWGHEGQVFHESIVMQAYGFMDAGSAEDSQRVFMDRQRPDGYIAYRVGPYVTKTFPLEGEDSSSAPFFNWTNWELYRISHDRQFLQQAYDSGSKFADFILKTRNKDGDGFLEWGGNAMLECVRDELDVIWSLFGGGDASPKKVKSLDLTVMMVKETRSLAAMAQELGRPQDAARWEREADRMAELVRTRMWDPETGFFYNLARDTGTFTTRDGLSMKRKEIIGFLPLWAGIATREQAARLRQELTNPESFGRRFGAPTLAANDSYYDPYVTKCCQWNGAVWLLWDYMAMRGLLDYGYRADAELLFRRNMDAVIFQLANNHRFWESFSPDYTQLNSPRNYLWDAIIAREMIELYGSRQ